MTWRPSSAVLATVALSLLTLGWTTGLALVLWGDLDAAQRDALGALLVPRWALVVLFMLLLPLLAAWIVRPWIRAWPRTVLRMREEVTIIGSANPDHRIRPTGTAELRALAAAVNALADTHAALKRDVEARIGEANASLAKETQRLAALMSELTQGVLVCNSDGRILLYNASASRLLERDDAGTDAGAGVGLGRSVFGVLDKGAIVHTLDQLTRRLEQQTANPVATFVTTRRREQVDDDEDAPSQLLRVQMVPLHDEGGGLGGYVLILDDITSAVESDSRRDALLLQLTEGTRASLGNLRAAVETLQRHPTMDVDKRARFTAVIHEESERLSRQIGEALTHAGDPAQGAWPRDDMLAADLLFALQRSLNAAAGVSSRVDPAGAPQWLHLDSHSMMQALTYLVARLAAELEVREIELGSAGEGRFARLEMRWQGHGLDPQRLHGWEDEVFAPGSQGRGLTVKHVLSQHGAEIWTQSDHGQGRHRLCLQLPTAQPARQSRAAAKPSRPVYYDFDLFHQRGQSAALDEMPLARLTFTVFDTETTGLAPSEGDEIISIGAVRIVNGRLLEHECFDRLIKPRRKVQRESQAVHGISPEMLKGQPPLEQVLPLFARFSEDTVLVAHNAAFDMRFLELAHKRTGVRFEQPVLDTLLLSSLIHPGHRDREHRLEHIANRLGIDVIGRHTALGDAIVTGEVFLKLLPLLAEQGIRTLAQAREASRQSSYATLEY